MTVEAATNRPDAQARERRNGTRPQVDITERLIELAHGYQLILDRNPQQPSALVGMSLVAIASHQAIAAVKMAAAAAQAAPQTGTAWVALGLSLKTVRRFEEAREAYMQAIRLDGMDPLARRAMGDLMIVAGHPEEAIREFDLALKRQPGLVSAHMGMGSALAYLGRNEESLERYKKALDLQPRLPEGEFAMAFVLARLGRTKEAEKHYRRAINEKPDFAQAWLNLGSLLRDEGNELYAEAAFERAVTLQPNMASGWVHLASLERDRKHVEKAQKLLFRALAINPNRIETLMAWCHFRADEKDFAGAWQWLRWAYAQNPNHQEAVNMHGILLHLEGRFEEAVEVFTRAEELGSTAAASNRGNSLLDLGRMEEALKAQETAAKLDPLSAGAEYNLALTQLRLGHWAKGWPGYEARWRFREVHRLPRLFKQPRWKGEALNGQLVLLHTEQGLGDTIQFCRYAMLVVARGGRPVLHVQAAAERLLQSLAAVRAGLAEIAVMGTELSQFDYECPLLSMPAVFGTTTETTPWTGAYLGADPALAQEKRLQLFSLSSGPRVGLAWAGNPNYKADRHRSTRVETLLPLLRAVDATWISLQKGEPAKQLAELPREVSVWDGSSHDKDLAEAAAIIAGLDLVVTTDTCIAHLAGAMGKPVWVMLPYLPDWRWMEKIESSPWYPTMRLFRQKKKGDWAEVVERLIGELRNWNRAQFKLSEFFPLCAVPATHSSPLSI